MNRSLALLLLLSLTVLCSTGCRNNAETGAKPPNPSPGAGQPVADQPVADQRDDPPDDDPPGVASPEVLALAQGNNEFAFDLYARLAKKDGNVVFSPYSISTALAMTYAGARGATAVEMKKALRLPLEGEQLHDAFADLNQRLPGGGKRRGPGRLLLANSLWEQRGYPFRNEFLRLTREDYGAEPREVDFLSETEGARAAINRWVGQHTEQMIPELLKPGMLTSDSRLVLANAVFFQSPWAWPFQPKQTKDAPFHITAAESVAAPMMHLTEELRYFEGDGVQVLELPYHGRRWSMVVILPRTVDGLAAVEDGLTAARVETWIEKLAPYEVMVTLPKFTSASDLSLGEGLESLGMRLAFSRGADFSGMTEEPSGAEERLHLSEVVHQARVEVTEEGTKAAAATAAVMMSYTLDRLPRPWADFQADHPFFYMIRDRDAGCILFLGRVAKIPT